jgi:hypothetical protein
MDSRRLAALEALIAMAESIAPLLIAEGVSCPDAERVLRSVCIHAAARAESEKGNRFNASRLALLTGVDRHVVATYLRIAPKPDPTKLETRRHRLNRVLSEWHADPHYSDGGRPRTLEVRGPERQKSFWSLSKTYAKDAYPPLILQELLKVGAVEKLKDGRVRPRQRTYKAMQPLDEGAVQQIGDRVRDLTRTMLSNMNPQSSQRACSTVQTLEVDEEQLPQLRRALQERSQALATNIDQLLNSSKWQRGELSGRKVRVSWTCFAGEEPVEVKVTAPKEAAPRSPARRMAARNGARSGGHVPSRVAARKVGRRTDW